MSDRSFFVRLNLDDLGAEMDSLDSTEERGQWLEGFKVGSRGYDARDSWTPAKRQGHAFGLTCWQQAEAFRQVQSAKGRASAEARRNRSDDVPDSNHGSTTVQPEINHGSNRNATGTQPIHNPESINQETNNKQPHPPTPQRGSSVSMFDSLIPEVFRTTEFVEAWHLWVSDRKDRRKPITIAAATLQMRSLLEGAKTSPEAVRWIQVAISNGWQGLFPPRDGIASNRTASTGTRRSSDEEWKARNAEALKPYTPAPGENHGPAF